MDSRTRISLVLLLCPFWLWADFHLTQISDRPKIYIMDHFLSDDECDHLIALGEPTLERSFVAATKSATPEMHPGRTSSSTFLQGPWRDPIVMEIEERISALLRIPCERAEAIQIAHYLPLQEYQPHYDTFDLSTPSGRQMTQIGGQRVATFIIYLNTPEEGGTTDFPRLNISVKPTKGSALIFYPCHPDGRVDLLTLHAGRPVIKGEKWIATRWFRQYPYR